MMLFPERMPRAPLVKNNRSPHWITSLLAGIPERKAPLWWWCAVAVTASLGTFGLFCIIYLLWTGVGVWGNNIPVAWAWGITNFVFWIGIGHAGTLISAILFLCRQKWRTAINRSALSVHSTVSFDFATSLIPGWLFCLSFTQLCRSSGSGRSFTSCSLV